jgi:hypothetical protein
VAAGRCLMWGQCTARTGGIGKEFSVSWDLTTRAIISPGCDFFGFCRRVEPAGNDLETMSETEPDISKLQPLPIEVSSAGQANADLAAADAPGDRQPEENLKEREEKLIDEGVEETFPASDPVSVKRIT